MTRPAIILRLPADAGGAVALSYTPRGDVTGLLAAAPMERVPSLVRTLFAICANAQGHAAELAMEAALGLEATTGELMAREIRTWTEGVREHALRISLDWARVLGEAPDLAAARAFMALSAADDPALLIGEAVTGLPPERWLAMTSTVELARWAGAGRTVAARFIATLFEAAMLTPTGEGDPGSLAARHADHPLLSRALPAGSLIARHVARLIDLCRVPARLDVLRAGDAAPLRGTAAGPGLGMASVPCARGTLVHEVGVVAGRVERYRILSPTDRAFAPGGWAERQIEGLCAWPSADRARWAEVMMLALDPCVDYAVEVA
ncbi:hydrogenase expression/formation protein HupK [Nitrospirillum viridazoti Y2]|uniref:Coenzyme F420-reducing hydrogenase alpha subunit n=1 Tax=Nitrospirillum amazonense TaxID=28077 RepID=A0A560INX9_9PROT|nr:hypothetical protein [Nitrospirillum amazonense]EGX99458.1 hydrogenase expression/formation protein HupK [Nitrospirillum amazonense Y2]TWB60637.1 hypothetical protein FBZ92_106198 [Nitrospirillum amazonense]